MYKMSVLKHKAERFLSSWYLKNPSISSEFHYILNPASGTSLVPTRIDCNSVAR